MLKPDTLKIRPQKIVEARRAISKLLAVLGTQDINEALTLIRNEEDGGYIMGCDIPILRKTQVEMGNTYAQGVIQKAIEEFNRAYELPVELEVERTFGSVVAERFIDEGYNASSKPSSNTTDLVKVDLKGKDNDVCYNL